MKMTPPIGFNEQGQVIEEVVTTASRLPPAPRLQWAKIFAAGALALLAVQLLDDPPRRRARRRRR